MTPNPGEERAADADSQQGGGTDRASPRRWWMLPLKLVLAAAITWLILRGAGLTLAEAWEVDWSVVRLNVPFLVLSALLLLVAFVIPAALWSRVLVAFGETPVTVSQGTAMLLVANLGRYVPGKVVQVAGLAVLARRAGMSGVRATGAAIVAQILNLIGAAILGGWVAYQMNGSHGAVGLAVGLGAVLALVAFLHFGGAEALLRWTLKRVGHSGEPPRAAGRRLLLLVPGYILNWIVFGAAFASLAAGLGLPIPFVFATTAFAAAYFAGYISFLPAGIGVREGSLVFLLTPLLGPGPSVVLAALQRVWITAVELAAAAAGVWMLRVSGSAGAEQGPERIGKSYYGAAPAEVGAPAEAEDRRPGHQAGGRMTSPRRVLVVVPTAALQRGRRAGQPAAHRAADPGAGRRLPRAGGRRQLAGRDGQARGRTGGGERPGRGAAPAGEAGSRRRLRGRVPPRPGRGDFDVFIEMDADLSHPPDRLPASLVAALGEAGVAVGSRYVGGRITVVNWPMSRLLISLFGSWYARVVTRIPVNDATGGFNAFRREVVEAVGLEKIESNGYSFQIELKLRAWRAGYALCEVPIVFTERDIGESKMSRSIIVEAVWRVWKLRLLDLFGRL